MGACTSAPLEEKPAINVERQNLILKHEIEKKRKQLEDIKFTQLKNSKDFEWEYQFRGDQWIQLDRELAAYLETIPIGEMKTIERGPGGEIINTILRESISSATVCYKYKSSVSKQLPRNCRRLDAADIAARSGDKYRKKQLEYKQDIDKFERQNKDKSAEFKLLDLKMEQSNPKYTQINDEINQIKNKMDGMTEGIPAYSGLTSAQSSKVLAMKKLLNIDDDKSLIYLLKLSEWQIADASEEYYKWSGKTRMEHKTVWKWRDDDGKWKNYDDATVEIMNKLEVGKEVLFRIFDCKDEYKFIKSTPYP